MNKKTILLYGTPLFVAITCIYGIMYLGIQQYIRLSANEIPLQYAVDVKTNLEKGMAIPQAINALPVIDMESSLTPFIMIFDADGTVKAGTGMLHGHMLTMPRGVFLAAKKGGENRITWQPQPGIRNATVILPYSINGKEGYVVGGRSMRETEKRIHFLSMQLIWGYIITLIATFAVFIITHYFNYKFSV